MQIVGMNIFMLWMSGFAPGIINAMALGYCAISIIGELTKMQEVFLPFKDIDTTYQKMAYFILCTMSLIYLLWQAFAMGMLPTSSADWIASIPNMPVAELSMGVLN